MASDATPGTGPIPRPATWSIPRGLIVLPAAYAIALDLPGKTLSGLTGILSDPKAVLLDTDPSTRWVSALISTAPQPTPRR
ncbi:hypothetical protein [Nocardia yamanashiensis]|uniref:hypothetical protein n=1 Tax=Nocardia yamanashiensis TaxID=209247 RepID=UPI0008374DEE|nr:hypothetical protein [Nocardia yamanashiensis]